MKLLKAMTKTYQCRSMLEIALRNALLHYKVIYFEDHSESLEKYQTQHSTLLLVDEKGYLGGLRL